MRINIVMVKESTNKTKIILILGAIAIILASVILLPVFKQNKFEHEGWINCQPLLSEEEAELCRQAEAAEYPYIAY